MPKPFIDRQLVVVEQSPIHGKGLFAARPIARDTQIGQCRTCQAKGQGPYVIWLDDEGEERYRVLCDLRFINHGRPANVAYYDDLSVFALRDIEPGEELLHDYGDEW